MRKKVYADYAATTPLCTDARDAMLMAFDTYGNPSSLHHEGVVARKIVEAARETVAAAINAEPDEIYFTSGATEANEWALSGETCPLVSTIEHSSVLEYPRRGTRAFLYGKSGIDGLIAVKEYMKKGGPTLCSVMLVNNETGTIQDIQALCDFVHQFSDVRFHTDATQAVGHIPVDVKELGCDMLSMSAHKFGGPKGVGALFIRRGVKKASILHGGGQEGHLRAGTENVIGIAGMAAAIEWATKDLLAKSDYLSVLKSRLISGMQKIDDVFLVGDPTKCSPFISCFIVCGVEGQALVLALDERGVCASSGSACHEGSFDGSHVLRAMGYTDEAAKSALRISIGTETSVEDVDYIVQAVEESVKELRR